MKSASAGLQVMTVVLLASCFQIGPPFPERDATAYLSRRGYGDQVIRSVVRLERLEDPTFAKLAKERSTDVRYLIAKNPYLPADLLDGLTRDRSSFVRGGAALSPNLTSKQIQALYADTSHTTLLYLARNPIVPEECLIKLHEERGLGLDWLAMNPRCPSVLRKKIRDGDDDDAKNLLDFTERRAARERDENDGQKPRR